MRCTANGHEHMPRWVPRRWQQLACSLIAQHQRHSRRDLSYAFKCPDAKYVTWSDIPESQVRVQSAACALEGGQSCCVNNLVESHDEV